MQSWEPSKDQTAESWVKSIVILSLRIGVVCYKAKGKYIPLNNHLSLGKSLRISEPQFSYLLNGDSRVVRWTRRGSVKRGLSMAPRVREALHSLLPASLPMLLSLLSSRTHVNIWGKQEKKQEIKGEELERQKLGQRDGLLINNIISI